MKTHLLLCMEDSKRIRSKMYLLYSSNLATGTESHQLHYCMQPLPHVTDDGTSGQIQIPYVAVFHFNGRKAKATCIFMQLLVCAPFGLGRFEKPKKIWLSDDGSAKVTQLLKQVHYVILFALRCYFVWCVYFVFKEGKKRKKEITQAHLRARKHTNEGWFSW